MLVKNHTAAMDGSTTNDIMSGILRELSKEKETAAKIIAATDTLAALIVMTALAEGDFFAY